MSKPRLLHSMMVSFKYMVKGQLEVVQDTFYWLSYTCDIALNIKFMYSRKWLPTLLSNKTKTRLCPV